VNEVVLVGRLAAEATGRTLPSGDELLTWRMVVDRPTTRAGTAAAGRGRAVTIDTVDCVAWAAGVRRSVGSWAAGDVIRVEGALRRRFWRARTGGPASRYEVEALKVGRVARAQ
jgi:single-strand DNA-binding protein